MSPAAPRIGLALAAGGERLVPWYLGLLDGLLDGGLDLRAADPVVGTSAGAYVAAKLAAGADPRLAAERIERRTPAAEVGGPLPAALDAVLPSAAAHLFDGLATLAARAPTPHDRCLAVGRLALEHSPGGELAHVERARLRIPADPWPAALRVVALDAACGERVVFGPGDDVPLYRAVAAARSVPVLCPPVDIGGRAHIDGAVHSATNADLLACGPLDLAIVFTGSAPDGRGVDAVWNVALAAELAELERAGTRTLVVRPAAAAQAAMGPDPMSRAGAPAAVRAGREHGRALALRVLA